MSYNSILVGINTSICIGGLGLGLTHAGGDSSPGNIMIGALAGGVGVALALAEFRNIAKEAAQPSKPNRAENPARQGLSPPARRSLGEGGRPETPSP
jgi:hypothetical protein